MASVSANIHIHAEDKPFIQRLESGSIAIWVQDKHVGPTICGARDNIAKLRDAIDAYLKDTQDSGHLHLGKAGAGIAMAEDAKKRAAALSDLAASDAELL